MPVLLEHGPLPAPATAAEHQTQQQPAGAVQRGFDAGEQQRVAVGWAGGVVNGGAADCLKEGTTPAAGGQQQGVAVSRCGLWHG